MTKDSVIEPFILILTQSFSRSIEGQLLDKCKENDTPEVKWLKTPTTKLAVEINSAGIVTSQMSLRSSKSKY